MCVLSHQYICRSTFFVRNAVSDFYLFEGVFRMAEIRTDCVVVFVGKTDVQLFAQASYSVSDGWYRYVVVVECGL
jgi:hypothetical protein